MEEYRNPFAPGAGALPPTLVGREEILERVLLALARVKRGYSAKSMLVVGLRGTGKTVLLHEIAEIAEREGYHVVTTEAHEKKPFR